MIFFRDVDSQTLTHDTLYQVSHTRQKDASRRKSTQLIKKSETTSDLKKSISETTIAY